MFMYMQYPAQTARRQWWKPKSIAIVSVQLLAKSRRIGKLGCTDHDPRIASRPASLRTADSGAEAESAMSMAVARERRGEEEASPFLPRRVENN